MQKILIGDENRSIKAKFDHRLHFVKRVKGVFEFCRLQFLQCDISGEFDDLGDFPLASLIGL